MTTLTLLLQWQLDPFAIVVAAAGVSAFFVFGRERKRRWGPLTAATVVFLLAILSPIGTLARGYLFSAHMLQHILLVLVVPPLALLALPMAKTDAEPSGGVGRFVVPWLLGVGAMWFWHAPTLCDAASSNIQVWRVQTLSLLAMGSGFWWPILGGANQRLPPFGGIVYLFTACIACTILGVLVTFTPVEVCSVYAHPVDRLGVLPLLRDRWGLDPKGDQQVGGLLMWVPGCLVYAASIVAVYGRYVRGAEAAGPA